MSYGYLLIIYMIKFTKIKALFLEEKLVQNAARSEPRTQVVKMWVIDFLVVRKQSTPHLFGRKR